MKKSKGRTEEEIKQFLLLNRGFTKEGCWYWMKRLINNYGQVTYQGRQWQVHRLSFKLFRPDEYRDGLLVLHKNECSSRRCFNPDHLYMGNNSDNQQDAVKAKVHVNSRKNYCPQGHEYNEENTYTRKINGWRQCKICHNIDSMLKNLNKGSEK